MTTLLYFLTVAAHVVAVVFLIFIVVLVIGGVVGILEEINGEHKRKRRLENLTKRPKATEWVESAESIARRKRRIIVNLTSVSSWVENDKSITINDNRRVPCVLCEDGTMWRMEPFMGKWVQLPEVPPLDSPKSWDRKIYADAKKEQEALDKLNKNNL